MNQHKSTKWERKQIPKVATFLGVQQDAIEFVLVGFEGPSYFPLSFFVPHIAKMMLIVATSDRAYVLRATTIDARPQEILWEGSPAALCGTKSTVLYHYLSCDGNELKVLRRQPAFERIRACDQDERPQQ